MSIIDHTLNKYDKLFRKYLDLLPLNLVYFVLENYIFLAVGTMTGPSRPTKWHELIAYLLGMLDYHT